MRRSNSSTWAAKCELTKHNNVLCSSKRTATPPLLPWRRFNYKIYRVLHVKSAILPFSREDPFRQCPWKRSSHGGSDCYVRPPLASCRQVLQLQPIDILRSDAVRRTRISLKYDSETSISILIFYNSYCHSASRCVSLKRNASLLRSISWNPTAYTSGGCSSQLSHDRKDTEGGWPLTFHVPTKIL